MLLVAVGATHGRRLRWRLAAASLRQFLMTARATELDRPRRPQAMRAVARGAMGRSHFRPFGDEHAMLAALILAQNCRCGGRRTGDPLVVAGPAKLWSLVRSRYAVGVGAAARFAVRDACAVAGVARKRRFRVRVAQEIRRSFRMARLADFVDGLLRSRRAQPD